MGIPRLMRASAFVVLALTLVASGCVVRFANRSPWDIEKIQQLTDELDRTRLLAQLKAEEADQLRRAKADLDSKLGGLISNKDVDVGYDDRGLVVRVLDQVLFESGQAKVKSSAGSLLSQIAGVLNGELSAQPVGIEGHTDNVPIKSSGWKDNWDLSLARARAVLKHLEKDGVEPSRLRATGYGEYHPIELNDTPEGRRKNRRVEIVILPQSARKASQRAAQEAGETTDGGETRYTK